MDSVAIGEVAITALIDGYADLRSPITRSFPEISHEQLEADQAIFPDVYGPGLSWRLMIISWLLESPEGLLLVDTGVGPHTSPTLAWWPELGRLPTLLGTHGVDAASIKTVVLSHVHDDHIGGSTTLEGAPAFPNARYVLQRADFEAQRGWARSSDQERHIWERILQPLHESGVVQLLDGDTSLTPQIEAIHAPGHTPGHQIVRVTSEDQVALLLGDTWDHPTQLRNAAWPSGSDVDVRSAARTRESVLRFLEENPETIVGPAHFGEPFGRLRRGVHGDTLWEPLAGHG